MRALQWVRNVLSRLGDLSPRQLLVIAGVSGLCMFGLMYAALMGVEKEVIEPTRAMPDAAPQISMKTVVVAKTNISAQTLLKREMFETREMPENLVPANAVTDVETILNRPAKTEILAGDVMTPQRVFDESEPRGFIGMIPKDCRAVSVRVNDITGVAGFAKPGDRVDVILSEKDENFATTSILLQNVLLLSINGDMGVGAPSEDQTVDPSTQAISNPSIATLALKPDEVLQLISASKLGEIYLMLRPLKPLDGYVDSGEVIFRGYKAPKPKTTEQKAPTSTPAPSTPAPAPSSGSAPAPTLDRTTEPEERPATEQKPASKPEPRKFEIIYGDE